MGKKVFDKTDFFIIKELSKNARASASEIAKNIDVNERTVRRRLAKLVETKAIRFAAIVDPGIFGYQSIADINLKVNPDIYSDFLEKMQNNPNVCYIATGWGDANLAIETRFLKNDEMYHFIYNVLPHTEGVEVLNFFIIPKIIYNIDQWLPSETDFDD